MSTKCLCQPERYFTEYSTSLLLLPPALLWCSLLGDLKDHTRVIACLSSFATNEMDVNADQVQLCVRETFNDSELHASNSTLQGRS